MRVMGRGVPGENGLVRLSHEGSLVLPQLLLLVPALVVHHECVPQDGVVLQPFHHLVFLLECQAASVLLVPAFLLALEEMEATVEVEAAVEDTEVALEPAEAWEDTEEDRDLGEGSREES